MFDDECVPFVARHAEGAEGHRGTGFGESAVGQLSTISGR